MTFPRGGDATFRGTGWRDHLAQVPPRTFPGDRALGIGLRTIHLLTIGLVFGGLTWGVHPDRWRLALVGAVGSGAALMLVEIWKSPHWLLQGKGLFVVAKLLLLAGFPLAGSAGPMLLAAVIVLGSVGAHLPSRFRHFSLLLRRPVGGLPKAAPPSRRAFAAPWHKTHWQDRGPTDIHPYGPEAQAADGHPTPASDLLHGKAIDGGMPPHRPAPPA